MSQDAEKVKRLIGFRERLRKRVEELENELKEQQAMLEVVNSILLEKGFKRVEITPQSATSEMSELKEAETEPEAFREPKGVSEDIVQLKTGSGELLAILHVTENSLRALPAGDKDFNVNTAPFTQFLIERVLMKMQERDSELVRSEQLRPDKMFSYNIVREGDVIREIVVRNVDPDRLRELKSSIRWTFEKMYEKMRTQS